MCIQAINDELWLELDDYRPTDRFVFSALVSSFDTGEGKTIMLNGLTGAMDVLPTDSYTSLAAGVIPGELNSSIKHLQQRGYLFRNKDDEARVVSRLVEDVAAQVAKQDIIAMVSPLDTCPMGCTYCFNKDANSLSSSVMKENVLASVFSTLATIKERYGKNCSRLVLYGGEPFQERAKPVVKNIIDECRSAGIKIAAFSNGYDLGSFIPLLREHKELIDLISVTVDGDEEYHDSIRRLPNSHKRALDAIEELLAAGIPTQLKMNISSANFDKIESVLELCSKREWLGQEGFYPELSPVVDPKSAPGSMPFSLAMDYVDKFGGRNEMEKFDILPLVNNKYFLFANAGLIDFSDQEIPAYARVPRIYHCPSYSGNIFVFSSGGDLYLCNEELGKPTESYGKFLASSELDWENLESRFVRRVDRMKGCAGCPMMFICGGGCHVHAGQDSIGADLSAGHCGEVERDIRMFFKRYGRRLSNLADSS